MSQRETMLERVAKAMRGSVDRHEVRLLDEEWLEAARAAIEAMREPTEEIVRAFEVCPASGYETLSAEAKFTWQAMIDAALAPPPKGETDNG